LKETLIMRNIFIFLSLLAATISVQSQVLERIQRTKTITIAHRESSVPFSYLDANKKPIGFAVDLCQRIAEAIRIELKLPLLTINYVPVSSSTRIPVITEGKADMECGTTTDNIERRQQVSFSYHYYFASVQMLVKTSGSIKNWDDLDGKTIVVTKGTTTINILKKAGEVATRAFKVVEGKDHAESFTLLESGAADAFVMEDVLLAGFRANAKDPKQYVLAGRRLTIEPYGLILPKGDEKFRYVVNRQLRNLMESGEFARIYEQWFLKPIAPNNTNMEIPASFLLREQIRKPSGTIPGVL
jgi:ABC-type amino acid transport substrate-binding protein